MLCANDSYQSLAEIARLGSLLYHAAAFRRTEPTRRAEEARRRPRHRGISPARASRRFDSRACSMLEAVGAKRLMRSSIEVVGSGQACTHSPREMHPRPALVPAGHHAHAAVVAGRLVDGEPATCTQAAHGGRNAQSSGRSRDMRELIRSCGLPVLCGNRPCYVAARLLMLQHVVCSRGS